MKKIIKLIIFFVLLFSLFLYFYLRPTSYELNYNIDDFKVIEKYESKDKKYYVTIKNEDYTFEYVTFDKYSRKRNLINKIEVEKIEDAYCLKPTSNLSIYPLCYQDKEYISYYALKENEDNINVLENYENINVYNFHNKTYLLWNYHNFIYLNQEKENKYEILDKDLYNLKLVMATSRYLMVPSQENDYTFNSFYVIDAKKNKMKKYNLDREIYFDSYYLGSYKNSIYLVDRKNNQEYELNLKKGKQIKTDGKVLNEKNKWEKVNISKLVHNEYQFKNNLKMNYELKDNNLYVIIGNTKIKITNENVSTIVKENDYEVYYVVKDSLYYFNLFTGSEKIMAYSEWEFNYNNMIYIFD